MACVRACPTKAIRVRNRNIRPDSALCINCGACAQSCEAGAIVASTSSQADLGAFKHKVALPSLTLYGQFGRNVQPPQVWAGLRKLGFDSCFDMSWVCEMVAAATEAHLAESRGPWPRLSIDCPAIVRLVQVRYQKLIPHLIPIETPRELGAKYIRHRLSSDLGLDPAEIGIFFITPCAAVIESILSPVGLASSHLSGAFSIAEMREPLAEAIASLGPLPADPIESVSRRGLLWALAGGQIRSMRSTATATVCGIPQVISVLDRIASGAHTGVDFLELHRCPDGCVAGHLGAEDAFAVQSNLQRLLRRMRDTGAVRQDKVLGLIREHFFDLENEILARRAQPTDAGPEQQTDSTEAIAALASSLPRINCAACGAPDCDSLAADVISGQASIDDCVCLFRHQCSNKIVPTAFREADDE